MVNQYDLFVVIAKEGSITIKELKKIFVERAKTPQHIYHHINKLVQTNLITRQKGVVEVTNSKNGENLYTLLRYCVENNLDYQFYFAKNTLGFLKKIYGRLFTVTDAHITPQQFKAIADQLEKDTFLIRYKKKPFLGRILRHTFLEQLLQHHRIKIPQKNMKCSGKILNNILFSRRKALRSLIPLNKAGFTHTSLALEGNLLTLRETELLLKEHIAPKGRSIEQIQEVLQYEQGIKYLDRFIAFQKPLNVEVLQELHKEVMKQKSFGGKIRNEDVTIKGNPHFKTAPHEKIDTLLHSFNKDWNSFKNKNHILIIEEAAKLHNAFQYIHPFIDGNSRTTRLLLYGFLRIHNISFHDIPLGFTTEYLSATKGATKRDDQVLSTLLKEILIQTIKK
ncbi:Fic family protein [Candidatus Woesearchaeota archaeon]|nr:Fic family protein [Candidatus Woesearchaeota archaeon]